MVQKDIKSIVIFYLQMILLWIFAILLFMFFRNYGVEGGATEKILQGLSPRQIILINIPVGTVAGIIYASVELIFESPYFQKHSYGRIILSKLILFFFVVKLVMSVGITITAHFSNLQMELDELIQILRSKVYWVIFVFFLLVSALISFIRMVNQKFGPGVLWNMFIGKYRNPREEERVFMFLDLKSSTMIAEKLGHIKFSRMIQDCFADLTPVVTKHRVEIYQYVGDEAVLSWPLEDGLDNNRCIHCYFDYMEVLSVRSNYYLKEYGIAPKFKAGVHLGKVIVAEVGLIKREIAYHGDVLNTTARLQGKCNALKQQLLISNSLLQYLQPDEKIQSRFLAEELLRGKKQTVGIYGVTKNKK